MLDRYSQRIKAKFVGKAEAEERLKDLRIEFGRGINFEIKFVPEDGGYFLAKSTNLPAGVIVTSAKTEEELDKKIKDAIFTAFEIPSQYCDFSAIVKEGETVKEKSVMYAAR